MKTTTIVLIVVLACAVLAPLPFAEALAWESTEQGAMAAKCVSVNGNPSNPIDVYECPGT